GTVTDAGADSVRAIAVDGSGNVYLGGRTQYSKLNPIETGFPTTAQSLLLDNGYKPEDPCDIRCGYILKLDADGRVAYGALFPGLDVKGLAVDAGGAVYATGLTLAFHNNAA